MTLHHDELAVDLLLVRRLLARSLPSQASAPLEPLTASGSSNVLFRLGDDLLVRLPRQPGGSVTIAKEARWLPVIAAGLTMAVPEVVAVGEPGFGYPETWLVTRWLDGRLPGVPWDETAGGSSRRLAEDLATLVTELRRVPMPAEALEDPALSGYRGSPLAELDEDFHEAVRACRAIGGLGLDLHKAHRVWRTALAAQEQLEPAVSWYHGDLLAENLLLRDGRLAAVLDFGGLAVGDPAVDLVVAWEVLDRDGRDTFRRALNLDEPSWATSKGWALLIAMITFPYYWETMPARCAARRAMAAAVLDDSPG